jgi:hypothetical protein
MNLKATANAAGAHSARGEEPLNLPRYRCHKEVRASADRSIETGPERAKLTLDGPRVAEGDRRDYLGSDSPRVGGYFVMYTTATARFRRAGL